MNLHYVAASVRTYAADPPQIYNCTNFQTTSCSRQTMTPNRRGPPETCDHDATFEPPMQCTRTTASSTTTPFPWQQR
ncbi:hypothetical protein DEO72_LG1g2800 [Vigna unguiculata]|uniref:Uncharacterized protein n=1 Tax=Vigna unguiculata TaxID=3917 RepID=A0A4D6KXA9_VIGUN|nr:hypothetical protein DEO72_LG1g2800 [Vigna unguiculata]